MTNLVLRDINGPHYNMFELILDYPVKTMNECKGKLFRCKDTRYTYDEKGKIIFGHQTLMRELKRKSCPGCAHCEPMIDDLKDTSSPIIKPVVKHGGLYRLDYGNISRDWETGIVDDWDLIFTLIEE